VAFDDDLIAKLSRSVSVAALVVEVDANNGSVLLVTNDLCAVLVIAPAVAHRAS